MKRSKHDAMLNGLLHYVEIQTKITSVFPFLMTLAYLRLNNHTIDPLRSAVFFAGMFLFDLTATTINNYNDTKKNGLELPFPRRKALGITLTLLSLSVGCGLWLAVLTDIVVLLAGALCFLFGILYSWGPVRLSHGPFGEMASGFFYGVMIPFLCFYINDPTALMTVTISMQRISLEINVLPSIGLMLLGILPFCLTANVMLANNICDVERDVRVDRYTLAFYLKEKALTLFALLYYATYLSVIVMVVFRFLTPLSLFLLITLLPVQRNIRIFAVKQTKEETFVIAIKNFILIISVHIALICLGILVSVQ